MRALILAAILLCVGFAGCLAADDPDPAPVNPPARIEAGTLRMDVPVPIFLIGFDEATAEALRDALPPRDLQPATFSGAPAALTPTATFEVHSPDPDWQHAFDLALPDSVLGGNAGLTGFSGTIYDGNAIEDYIHRHLHEIRDVPDGISSLVIVDPGTTGHAYHYDGDVGWREPVRAFGERTPLLIWDPTAEADPWVGEELRHHIPNGSPSAADLAAWIERATAIRVLQMPIWPPATEPCHAVTVILAVRSATVTPSALGLQSWDEALDIDRLQAAFENLTQDPVHVDLIVLDLPQDDPALEATTRENALRVVSQTYLDLNFDAYHVPHDGCEPYLSLVVYGDLVDQRVTSNGNAILMESGNRISTSLVAENVRVFSEVIGYNEVWDESTNFERVGPGAHPREWFNWVVSHETGHLFSLPHPNYSTGSPGFSDPGFASTWNVMGYQMRRIVTEMSAVDTNNFARNQAAYAVLGASGAALDEALVLMGNYHWKDAVRVATGNAADAMDGA